MHNKYLKKKNQLNAPLLIKKSDEKTFIKFKFQSYFNSQEKFNLLYFLQVINEETFQLRPYHNTRS